MSSNDASPLVPLDQYLSRTLFDDFILSEDFTRPEKLSAKYDGSLTLVNYKPMVASRFEYLPRYMPFIIEVKAPSRIYDLEHPPFIDVTYGEKMITLALGELNEVIEAYDFKIYERTVYVSIIKAGIIQDVTVGRFAFDVIMLEYNGSIHTYSEDERKSAEAKVKSLIQILESANPKIRENFDIMYKTFISHDNDSLLFSYIFLIPKGIINEISNFLLSQYEQIYGISTKPPAEFTPSENVQSPELQKFLDKLPLDLYPELVIGTYGSSPAVLLPEGDYSQYLTGNERVINLGKNVVIVFGNPQEQQTLTPEQQNIEQNKEEENSNTDLDKLEKVPNNAIAEGLGKEIQSIYGSIIEDDTINVEKKKHRLKTLNEALDELGKAILDALKSQTPLNANELRKYTEDIVKSAGLLYTNNFKYYLSYYERSLSETEELEVLATLLTSLGKTMYDIDKKIKEYNSLQLTY